MTSKISARIAVPMFGLVGLATTFWASPAGAGVSTPTVTTSTTTPSSTTNPVPGLHPVAPPAVAVTATPTYTG